MFYPWRLTKLATLPAHLLSLSPPFSFLFSLTQRCLLTHEFKEILQTHGRSAHTEANLDDFSQQAALSFYVSVFLSFSLQVAGI